MQIFEVGGAVRDELLGLPVKDRDFVVVGATPEQMIRLGYQPVGRDFPVFLHPDTHEEHALARTERKTAPGYKGFTVHAAPDVTLEQDLARRDLTINAIARDDSGTLIDPFGGVADLRNGILRHVSPAFAEDPVRVLRVARFAARFAFAIAPETLALMRLMSAAGEVDALVAERVWQELAKGLMEHKPSRMLLALRECGALEKILPEIDRLFGVPVALGAGEAGNAENSVMGHAQTSPAPKRAESQLPDGKYRPELDIGVHVMRVVDCAAARNLPLAARFAALTHDLDRAGASPEISPLDIAHDADRRISQNAGQQARGLKLLEGLCARLRVPNECRELARLTALHRGSVHRALELAADAVLKLLEASDAFRKPRRFAEMLQVCECDFHYAIEKSGSNSDIDVVGSYGDSSYPQAARLLYALRAAQTVDAGAIAAQSEPSQIRQRVHDARLQLICETLDR